MLAAGALFTTAAAVAQGPPNLPDKPTKVGTFLRVISGQPRNAKKVGLAFSSVHGVEIYYPKVWEPQEALPDGWSLLLTRPDIDKESDIHMEERPAYSLDQVLVDDTDVLTKNEHLQSTAPSVRKPIGDYKNIPALATTFVYGGHSEFLRRVVYFGYPPSVHALVLQCRPGEYDRLKADFEHILTTISIHDGEH